MVKSEYISYEEQVLTAPRYPYIGISERGQIVFFFGRRNGNQHQWNRVFCRAHLKWLGRI